MFYLVVDEYVGPNKKDSTGNFIGDSRVAEIWNKAQKTNSSHEDRIEGWLGTTNDNSRTAYGEFETIEEARAAATELGFSEERDIYGEYYTFDENDSVIEAYVSKEASLEQWDADDWFYSSNSRESIAESYGITKDTTDDQLFEIARDAEKEAESDGIKLHNCYASMEELRDYLIEESE